MGGGGGKTPGLGNRVSKKRGSGRGCQGNEDEDWGANCPFCPIVIV